MILWLLTAAGEFLPIYGDVPITISIGYDTVEHRVLLANIANDFMLEMDFRETFDFTLDFKRSVLNTDNVKLL